MALRARVVLIATLAVAATVASSTTVAANATTTHHSVSSVISHVTGKTLGPKQATDWGKATITGFTSAYNCGNHKTYWTAKMSFKQYPNPLVARAHINLGSTLSRPMDGPSLVSLSVQCPIGVKTMSVVTPDGMMHPDSWYNPTSWDWGSILGATWNNIVKKCLGGAATGLVGTASGTLIVNLIARGGKVFVGPYGYAAIAVGGCVVAVAF